MAVLFIYDFNKTKTTKKLIHSKLRARTCYFFKLIPFLELRKEEETRWIIDLELKSYYLIFVDTFF